MSRPSRISRAIASRAIDLVPPSVREELLADPDFISSFGIETRTSIRFSGMKGSVKQADLFDSVRECLAGGQTYSVASDAGEHWQPRKTVDPSGSIHAELVSGNSVIPVQLLLAFSPHGSERSVVTEELNSTRGFPKSHQEIWRKKLDAGSLSDDEFTDLFDDLDDTVQHVEQRILSDAAVGTISLATVVPRSNRYFKRLTGVPGDFTSIEQYATQHTQRIKELFAGCDETDTLDYALLVSPDARLNSALLALDFGLAEFKGVLERVIDSGNPLSMVSAIELGLANYSNWPEVHDLLYEVATRFAQDDLSDTQCNFSLFSSLFQLTYGELSSRRQFDAEAPTFRRLVSLIHASVVTKALAKTDLDLESIGSWAWKARGEAFYFQSMIDLRQEPRWLPMEADAEHFRQGCIGRTILAAHRVRNDIEGTELCEFIFAEGGDGLRADPESTVWMFPGPLEGGGENRAELPADIEQIVASQLANNTSNVESFYALANSVRIFNVPDQYAEDAAQVLDAAQHRLANFDGVEGLGTTLLALARVAAATRSQALAGQVNLLVRRYRRDPEYKLPIEAALSILLVSAAAHPEYRDWTTFLGQGVVALAFDVDAKEDAGPVHSHVSTLCELDPRLWWSLGRAEAALRSIR